MAYHKLRTEERRKQRISTYYDRQKPVNTDNMRITCVCVCVCVVVTIITHVRQGFIFYFLRINHSLTRDLS